MIGLLGKKIGMTQIFGEEGKFIPVSVIEVSPCVVLKTLVKSIQIGSVDVEEKRLKCPIQGMFKKLGIAPKAIIKEVKVDNPKDYKIGQELKVDIFKEGDFVDVIGISIGKGFQGGMKRWNWSGQPKTHGHTSHRRVGSIGASSDPSRVFRGTHMPGHMGHETVTTQNLKVVHVDGKKNILAVKGAIPGHKNSYLTVRTAKKKKSTNLNIEKNVEAKAKK